VRGFLELSRDQRIFEIGGVKLGGKLGELPTVLCGSIFYHKHKIVADPIKGVFDRAEAERLLVQQDEWADKTGNPCMVDVVGESSEALAKYLDFVADVTDAPILLNGLTAEIRVEALRYAAEAGLLDRVIYTSINYAVRREELELIRELGLEAALIQTFNPRNPMPRGSLSMLSGENGLLTLSEKYGITKPLLLPPVLDVPSIGLAAEAIRLLKEEVGLPTGAAPCGVVGYWKKAREGGRYRKALCSASALALIQASGADFVIYGSIRKAPDVFPVCAMVDAIIAYTARMWGVRPLTRSHPLYKYLPDRL